MNANKIAGVYVALVLGAGFASGQELLQFFVKYGYKGFFGLVLSAIIFGLVGYSVLSICFTKKYKNNKEFIYGVMGEKIGMVMNNVVAIFLFVLFVTMVAAGGATAQQAFNLPFTFGVIIMAILCFITFLYDIEGIVKINVILAPIMILGGMYIGLYVFFNQNTPVFLQNYHIINVLKENFVVAALVYASYNIVTAISVLASMQNLVTSKRTAMYGSLLTSLCLIAIGLSMALPLLSNFEFASKFEIPMLAIVYTHGKALEYFYLCILMAAIFTTAIGNGFSFILWLNYTFNINMNICRIIVVSASIIFAHIGFSNFVGKIYPIFGIIGFIEIIMIGKYFYKNKIIKLDKITKK